MANPINVTLPKGQWTKVASGVTQGNLYISEFTRRSFFHTYRVAGDPAPTDLTDAVPFCSTGFETIESSQSIDVYVYYRSTYFSSDSSVRVAV